MTRLVVGLATAALCVAPLNAQAQFNRTVIRDSGNGANNVVQVKNGPARHGFPGHFPGGGGDAAYPAQYGGGYPAQYGGYLGVQINMITKSG